MLWAVVQLVNGVPFQIKNHCDLVLSNYDSQQIELLSKIFLDGNSCVICSREANSGASGSGCKGRGNGDTKAVATLTGKIRSRASASHAPAFHGQLVDQFVHNTRVQSA